MAQTQYQIWTLQLMRYFISQQGYVQININTGAQSNEVWLINPQNETYLAVHISVEDCAADEEQARRLAAVQTTLVNFAKKDGRMLDICLNSSSPESRSENIDHIAVYPQCPLNEKIKSCFPGLQQAVFDTDDPGQESASIIESIKVSQKEQIKKNMRPGNIIRNNTGLTFWLFFIPCVVVWAAVNLIAYFTDTQTVSAAIFCGAYYKAIVVIFNDWWRLLTAGFVHIDFFHLWCNMLALFNLNLSIKDLYTRRQAIIIMIASIIAGNLCVFIGQENTVTVGLSGGLYGWMAALLVGIWQKGGFKDPVIRRQVLTTAAINIIICFMPNISLLAHLGGFISGLFLAFIFSKSVSASLRRNFAIVSVVLVMALGYMAYSYRSFNDYYYGTDLEVADICSRFGMKNLASKVFGKTMDYYQSH